MLNILAHPQPIRRRVWAWSGVVGILSLVGSVWAENSPIRMEGSDLLDAAVVSTLVTRAEEMGVTVTSEFAGSRPASDRLKAGVADLAIVVEPQDAAPWPEEWASVTLGYFTALVVAKNKLPVEQLNFENLIRVLGAESAVASTRWGEFGARGVWGSVPITAHVSPPGEGLAQVLFAHAVLANGRFKNTVIKHESTRATVAAVRDGDGGLGIVPWIPEGMNDLKVLLIARGREHVAFGPTPENIHAGDYPLRVPLKLVFARERAPELLDWLRFWFSDEMATALAKVGVVALPVSARNQQVFELEVIR